MKILHRLTSTIQTSMSSVERWYSLSGLLYGFTRVTRGHGWDLDMGSKEQYTVVRTEIVDTMIINSKYNGPR